MILSGGEEMHPSRFIKIHRINKPRKFLRGIIIG